MAMWKGWKYKPVTIDMDKVELRTITELMLPGELGNGIPRHLAAYNEASGWRETMKRLGYYATPEEIAQRTLDIRYHFAPRVSSYYLNRFIILKRETE